jgi:GAF domain-containing protein
MYDFKIDAADKASLYAELTEAAASLTDGEPDAIANMANVAALVWETLPDLNWAGFYRNVGGDPSTGSGQELVVGPFVGRPACIRIPFGKGVCGTAAVTLQPQCVADVHAFAGHIACDAASRSELVVPIVADGRLLGVLDLDSPVPGRFDQEDVSGCVKLIQRLKTALAGMADTPAKG